MNGTQLLNQLETKFAKQLKGARHYIEHYGDSFEENHEWFRQFIKGSGVDIASGNFPTDTEMLNVDGCAKLGNMSRGYIMEVSEMISIQTDSLDFVLCNYLDGFDQTLKTLHEWQRVLKPGGTLAVMCVNAEYEEYARLMGPMTNKRRVVVFTMLTLRLYLERAGYTHVKIDTDGRWLRAHCKKP